jgi:hypothetical protein
MCAQARNLRIPHSLDLTAFYTTTSLLYTLGKQRMSTPRKQRVPVKLQRNTIEPAIHSESDIQMETAIIYEPSQPNLDKYPRVPDELVDDTTTNCPIVIDYTPQMNVANRFTKALPELQYDQLHHYFVSTDSLKAKTY